MIKKLMIFEGKIMRKIFVPTRFDDGYWRINTDQEISDILKERNIIGFIYIYMNVMQLGSMFICNCNITLHVSDAFCVHLQEHLEIVEAASGE